MDICWVKVDQKSKKLNFMINQSMSNLDQKASVDTIENLNEQIESLQLKLDRISLNIQAQSDVEREHFECKYKDLLFWLTLYSDTDCYKITNMDMYSKDVLCHCCMCCLSLLHNIILQCWQQKQKRRRYQSLCKDKYMSFL